MGIETECCPVFFVGYSILKCENYFNFTNALGGIELWQINRTNRHRKKAQLSKL